MHARSHKNVNLRCRYSAARGEDALWHQSAWIAFEGRKWKWARKREWQLCHSLHTWYSFWIWCTNNREILSDRFVCLERAYRILNRRWTMRFLLWPAMIVLVVSFGSSCWVSRRPSSGKTVSHHMRQMLSLHDVSRTFAIDPLRRKRRATYNTKFGDELTICTMSTVGALFSSQILQLGITNLVELQRVLLIELKKNLLLNLQSRLESTSEKIM